MNEITRILDAIADGEPRGPAELLPLVYGELRKLAAKKLAHEKPGQTLELTALVHEAYLRLVATEKSRRWDSRVHFFAAAAEAMRRILVESARHKRGLRHGGRRNRCELLDGDLTTEPASDDLLDLDEARALLPQRPCRRFTGGRGILRDTIRDWFYRPREGRPGRVSQRALMPAPRDASRLQRALRLGLPFLFLGWFITICSPTIVGVKFRPMVTFNGTEAVALKPPPLA
jgi:RNA polymerase sigma factor (TIGR02999 family)